MFGLHASVKTAGVRVAALLLTILLLLVLIPSAKASAEPLSATSVVNVYAPPAGSGFAYTWKLPVPAGLIFVPKPLDANFALDRHNNAINSTLAGKPGSYVFSIRGLRKGPSPSIATYHIHLVIFDHNYFNFDQQSQNFSAEIGAPFEYAFVTRGAVGNVSYSISKGTLPLGLTLSSEGVLSGSPQQAGESTFAISATDRLSGNITGQLVSSPITITVTAAPVVPKFTSGAAPAGTVGSAYAFQVAADGAVSYAVTTGELPAGITLGRVSGQFWGIPTAAETKSFTITATSSTGDTATQDNTITITAAPVVPSHAEDHFND